MLIFSPDELIGRARTHIIDLPDLGCSLHHAVAGPFRALRQAALDDGIDLRAFSSFRDFDRQLAIWNAKARGERELLGPDSQVLDAHAMDEASRVRAILCWSALPGASRHHWGTDFDVMDAAAMPPGYRLQVIPAEYAPDGVFGRLSAWLDAHAAAFGFYRPYATWQGGVRPEPWHLSHAPTASAALAQFPVDDLRQALQAAQLEGFASIAPQLPALVAQYVFAVDPPPAAALVAS